MKRFLFATLALLVGCNGAGTSAGRFTPALPSSAVRGTSTVMANARRRMTKVRWRMTIPRRLRGEHRTAHPSTISPLTQSVGIAIDGLTPAIFNTTPTSPGCSAGPRGTTCTFSLDAPVGSDTFAVTTFGAANGGNPKLDYGTGVFKIAAGAANAVTISLGPVVSSADDSGVGSLRYAVGSASPGDTILFLLPAGSVITLLGAITISDRVSIAGPGSGVTISGGGTQQLFVVESGAVASISGLTLTQGATPTALQPGGDVDNLGTLTIDDDVLSDSVSTVPSSIVLRSHDVEPRQLHPHLCAITPPVVGGAIYSSGTLAVSDSTFEDDSVSSRPASCLFSNGGAIANFGGTMTIAGSTFTNDGAFRGGAIFNAGPATLTDDTFSGNTACTAALGCPSTACSGSGCSYAPMGSGAAILDAAGPGLSISDSTFEDNVAGGDAPGASGAGGALALAVGSPNVTGSTFTDNLSGGGTTNCGQGRGGAIDAAAGVDLTLSGDTFTGNEATGDQTAEGGAIYTPGSLRGSGDSFGTNQAIAYGSPCATGEAEGGALFLGASSQLSGESLDSNASVAEGTSGGATNSLGGAIYSTATLTLSGNVFSGNVAESGGSTPNDVYGGAVYAGDALSSVGDTFTSNAAKAPSSTLGDAEGGALYLTSTLTATADTISSNETSSGDISIGGAIRNNSSGSSIADSTLNANRAATATAAAAYGGAIFDSGGMTLSGSTLSGNTALQSGGAIWTAADETIETSTISGNAVTAATTTAGGGGIFSVGTITLVGSTVSGNAVTATTSAAGGGGIFNFGGLSMTGSTISGNAVYGSVAGAGGGGIFNYDDATITNSTVDGNVSQSDGGGFEAYQGVFPPFTVTLTNVTIDGNAATGTGGNIDDPGVMTMANSIVAGGSASVGLDIDNAGTLTSGDYNIVGTLVSGSPLTGATAFDQTVSPDILALTNNGGPTFTNADQSGGPGTAHIPFSASNCGPGGTGIDVDQRGYARGSGGFCDVGAYELNGIPSSIKPRIPVVHAHRHPFKIPGGRRHAWPKR